ncbi:MAG: hypothetical protein ABSH24_25415 [Bryobacteraceae bacterium]|jgi:hypothetical protein
MFFQPEPATMSGARFAFALCGRQHVPVKPLGGVQAGGGRGARVAGERYALQYRAGLPEIVDGRLSDSRMTLRNTGWAG